MIKYLMPEPAAFLGGFGLIKGAQFDGYQLTSATSTHESIKRYHEYQYHITLVFHNMGQGNYDSLYQSLKIKLAGSHVINSNYGNPYKCNIDFPPGDHVFTDGANTLTIQLLGHSYRV